MSPNSNSEKPINPNELLHIPKWVNEDYFLPILAKDVKNFDKIVNFTPIAATAPGENYTSIMIRVIVDILLKDGSQQKMSYILKTMLEADSGADVVNGMGLFPKEQQMYEVHIPQFVKLYKEAGLEIELAPKCLHVEATAELITLVQFLRAMRTWDLEDVERYIAHMWSPMEVFEEAMQVNQVDETEFNVLNHGDCWSNNIMFNYKDNGEIDRTIFIGKWGTPAQDLWYLITTSASLDIKIKEFDHFIQIYHERLAECLKLLNYSKVIPSLRDLHIMMLKYGFWGPLTATGVMVATLMPTDKDSNMKMMMAPGPEADALRYRTFSNPYYAKAMKKDDPEYEKILNFKPVAAIPPCENFTSVMLRIHFDLQMKDGSSKHKIYIFKTMLAEERSGKEGREGGIFDKELMMYQTYLPAYEELYRSAGAEVQLAPKCLLTDQRENGIHFVFEDLGVKKFKNASRA
ncbi:hypothetical protein M5D96_001288 [Drosophila gunungcola]|uniref:CHK kinase-like domain-containing protein n=1 Tax=Drosophila gunungcola TaxID=103775 RepID=A0A9Q0BV69_9MUSC|nr:hypothetical protein M5D96_001288 [Drosophila gunungcola]